MLIDTNSISTGELKAMLLRANYMQDYKLANEAAAVMGVDLMLIIGDELTDEKIAVVALDILLGTYRQKYMYCRKYHIDSRDLVKALAHFPFRVAQDPKFAAMVVKLQDHFKSVIK